MPVMLKSRKGDVAYELDEYFCRNCTVADMAKLKPMFSKKWHSDRWQCLGYQRRSRCRGVTEAGAAKTRGLKPLARLVAYAQAGVDPRYMGIGPVLATQMALKKAGLTVNDLDVTEANEAFAAQACGSVATWGWTRPRSTPTVRVFRWAIRLARLVP